MFFTNSLGFADRSARSVDPRSSKHRILLLGDSFTEGVGFPYDQTFAGIFSAALDNERFEVLNAAVSSYSPRLYYLKLKDLLEHELKIDEVFVYIDISDIQDEAFYARTGLVWADVEPRGFDSYSLARRAIPPALPTRLDRIRGWGATHLVLTVNGFKWIKAFGKPRSFDEGRLARGEWTSTPALLNAWGWDGLARCREHMEKIADLCRAHHIKLRVAVYPWPHQILAKEENSIQVKYWEKFCVSRDVPFLNYFPDFVGQGKPEAVVEEFFIPGDVHWNRKGHRKVSARLMSFWQAHNGSP